MEQILSIARTINTNYFTKKSENIIQPIDFRTEYELVESAPLGIGASGVVYRCICKQTSKIYALKIVQDNKQGINEITWQRKCHHSEHVVPIIDVFRSVGHHPGSKPGMKYLYIVMELQKGGNLFQFIKREGGVREETAVRLVRQIVYALQCLHKQGIIHKDLKPENILLSEREGEGEEKELCAKLSDFGFSCQEKSRPTRVEYTPYYVAPEVLCKDIRQNLCPTPLDLVPYDHRCDIWSLGVIIYSLLTENSPFFSERPGEYMGPIMYDCIQNARYTPPENLKTDISTEAKDLISNLLKSNPNDRLTLQQILEHPWML